jgi:signal peptidase II
LKKAFILVLLILIADQVFKIWIKTTMTLGQEIPVLGNWFILHFTENEGMAFGMTFGGAHGKLILSIFRIIASGIIGYYIWKLDRRGASTGLILCFALIMAGALGNILDSAFYGLIFSASSYHTVATLFPPEGGYAGFLHGHVVDMLYFPVIDTRLPEWMPLVGGQPFEFFRPVFNIADASISTGVIALIVFQRKFFTKREDTEEMPVKDEGRGDDISSPDMPAKE